MVYFKVFNLFSSGYRGRTSDKVEAFKYGLMAHFMKVGGKTTRRMAKAG